MTSHLREQYYLARQDLAVFEERIACMERYGVARPWAPALRQDLQRFAMALLAAVEDVERRDGADPDSHGAVPRGSHSP